jgi:hypothetical protein
MVTRGISRDYRPFILHSMLIHYLIKAQNREGQAFCVRYWITHFDGFPTGKHNNVAKHGLSEGMLKSPVQ